MAVGIAAAVLVMRNGGHDTTSTVGVAPKSAPSTAATTTTTLATYQVQRGDTLTSIAKHFGVTIAAIVDLNHLTDADRLSEGQTLQIPPVPPAPPLQLTVTPTAGPAGQGFDLLVTGAKAGETVTFEIDSPAGKYTGPPHAVSGDGKVSATYQTAFTDTPGTYTVIAKGNQGTNIQATFGVQPPSTGSTAQSR